MSYVPETIGFKAETKVAREDVETKTSKDSVGTQTSVNKGYRVGLDTIKDMLCEGVQKAEQVRGKEIVLFIGNLGAGKSTTIAYLMGSGFKQIKQNDRFIIVPEKEDGYPKIGHAVAAQTLFLELFEARGAYLCDSPGFFHNKTLEEKIAISLNLELVIRLASSVKIVVVLNYNELGDTMRGEGFLKLSDLLGKLFKNTSNIVNSISWIVTRTPSGLDNKDIIEQLTSTDGILDFLKNKVKKFKEIAEQARKGNVLGVVLSTAEGVVTTTEEANEFERQLPLVQGMCSNPYSVLLIDLFSTASKDKIFTQLNKSRSVSAEQFHFEFYDGDRHKFKEIITQHLYDGMELFNQNSRLKQEKAKIERDISSIEKQEKDYDTLEKSNYKEESIEKLKENWTETLKSELEDNQTSITNKKDRLKRLEKELEKIDTEEEVELESFSFKEKRHPLGYLGYSKKSFKYEDEPYDKVATNLRKGKLESEEVSPKKGIYSAKYVTGYGEDADVEIQLMVKKKNRKDNVLRIKQIKEEQQNLTDDIAALEKKCASLRRQMLDLNKKETGVEKIKSEKENKGLEKQMLNAKLVEITRKLSENEKKIADEKLLFKALNEIITTVQESTFADSDLKQKFKELYALHFPVESRSVFPTLTFSSESTYQRAKETKRSSAATQSLSGLMARPS